MKKVEREVAIIASGETVEEFEKAVNEALRKGASLESLDLPTLRAWLKFIEVTYTPESLRDQYALKGITPKCGDCPYYKEPTDRRLRYGSCSMYAKTDPKDDVCEPFFKWLDLGEVKLSDV